MPTVIDLFGLKFLIFTADHVPPHVHVRSANGKAKFNIGDTVELVYSSLRPKEQKLAEYILEENLELIQEEWKKTIQSADNFNEYVYLISSDLHNENIIDEKVSYFIFSFNIFSIFLYNCNFHFLSFIGNAHACVYNWCLLINIEKFCLDRFTV